jgi:hypothetical protein
VSALLPPAALAMTRTAAERVFDRACSVGHRTVIDTDTGREETWPIDPALDGIGCALREPRLGAEQLIAGRVTVGAVVTLLVSHDTPITDTDRVFLDTSETLNVVAVVAPVSGEILRRVVCEVVR